MKQTILAALLGVALATTALGEIISIVESPQDDLKVLDGLSFICDHPELQPVLAEYIELLEVRIHPLRHLTNIVACFGPMLEQRPPDRAKPLFVPMTVWESGLHSVSANKRHVEFHAIGDVGYLEVHYGYDGVWVAACAVHLRTDDKFVPLKSTNDFAARLKWDMARFDTLKKWFDVHLPKLTELGVVEVSESKPSHINLGADEACIINAHINHHPNVTKLWFEITIAKEAASTNAPTQQTQYKSIDRTNQSVGFSIDGKYYKLTPKLVENRPGAAADQALDLLHFAWGGGLSNIKTAEVQVTTSGKVTTRYEKQSQHPMEYTFALNKDELAALVESVRKVKFFDQPSDDTTFATDVGNSSITVNIGNNRRTVNYRYRPELGPLSQKVWELVEQGIITSELEQNGDVYPVMVASSIYLRGAKVYCPRLLIPPLKTNISLCEDSQKLEWGLTGLAWLLTSDQWLKFVSEQIEKASAERQVLLLRVLKSHPFTGNIPPGHARELVPLLSQIKEPERSSHTPR